MCIRDAFLKILLSSMCVSASVAATSVAAEEKAREIKCVKRGTGPEPPRAAMPAPRAQDGRIQAPEAASKLKPVCPEGETPELAAPSDRHFLKGNPMLRSYAAPGPARPLPGEFVNRNLLMPFDQVYWKRDGQVSPPPPPNRPHGSGDPPCDGVAWFGSCFYYGTASEQVVADGGGMTLQIEAPVVAAGDPEGHSIGEIAVMGAGGAGGSLDDVEMGFSVSPGQWGDNAPHLFVYHWNDGNETCYNSCDWHQYSNTYYPGMDLTALVGKFVYIGWVQYEGAWWGWFNDQWLGYIDNSAFSTKFAKTAQIQWYGEVASDVGIPPQTQMGDGEFPAQKTAAGMQTLCYVDAKAWVCFYNDGQSAGATDTTYYDIQNHTSYGAVRYGGSGQ